MENKHIIIIAILITIAAIILSGTIIYYNKNPCQEYKTRCFYGSRNTHTIDCHNSIESVPEGYSIYKERRYIKR